jgi:hypothetical protein
MVARWAVFEVVEMKFLGHHSYNEFSDEEIIFSREYTLRPIQ